MYICICVPKGCGNNRADGWMCHVCTVYLPYSYVCTNVCTHAIVEREAINIIFWAEKSFRQRVGNKGCIVRVREKESFAYFAAPEHKEK